MKTIRKKPKKGRYNFLIAEDVYNDFSLLCEDIGLVRSKAVEKYLKEFVDEHKSLLRRLKESD